MPIYGRERSFFLLPEFRPGMLSTFFSHKFFEYSTWFDKRNISGFCFIFCAYYRIDYYYYYYTKLFSTPEYGERYKKLRSGNSIKSLRKWEWMNVVVALNIIGKTLLWSNFHSSWELCWDKSFKNTFVLNIWKKIILSLHRLLIWKETPLKNNIATSGR